MDDIVLYLIVRTELGMTPGKVAIQASHATQKVLDKYYEVEIRMAHYIANDTVMKLSDIINEHMILTSTWKKQGSTKVILAATDKEWDKLKATFGDDCFIVRDAGKTEVEPSSETIMAFWPQRKSTVSKIIQFLPKYKG